MADLLADLVLLWLLRLELVLVLLGTTLWIPTSRRVIVAWTVFIKCRWFDPSFRRESQYRWLWIVTLRAANGEYVPHREHVDG